MYDLIKKCNQKWVIFYFWVLGENNNWIIGTENNFETSNPASQLSQENRALNNTVDMKSLEFEPISPDPIYYTLLYQIEIMCK